MPHARRGLPFVLAILLSACTLVEGVDLHVTNRSGERLHATAEIAGQTLRMGVIESGSSVKVRLRPASESHVELLVGQVGKPPIRYVIDTYLEPGYSGCIAATLHDNRRPDVLQTIDTGPRWVNCPGDAHRPVTVTAASRLAR